MKNIDKIAAIIPVHNRRKITLNCLSILSTFTDDHYIIDIIVVDDGSSDGTAYKIKELFPNVTVLHGDGNYWWAGSVNQGLSYVYSRRSIYQYILILNDDNIFTKSTFDYLYLTIKDYQNKTIVSAIAIDLEGGVIHCSGHKIFGYERNLYPILQGKYYDNNIPNIIDCDSLSSRFVIMPIDILLNIGYFDQVKFPQNFSDLEYFLRARTRGYRLLVNTKSIVLTKVNKNYFNQSLYDTNIIQFVKTFFDIKHPNNLKLMFYKSFCHRSIIIGLIMLIRSIFSKFKIIIKKFWGFTIKSNIKTDSFLL